MRITQNTIDRVYSASIYDVVNSYSDIKLVKNGPSAWKAPSPFNQEKTPSFYVVPAKNIFKCFSSGKGGGPVQFVMAKDDLTFIEAVKKVADIINERVEYEDQPDNYKEEVDHRETLYKINEAATNKYIEQLKQFIDGDKDGNIILRNADHPATIELIKRGYTPSTIVQWQLGYAPGDTNGYQPKEWRFITDLVGDKSYAGAKETGLIDTKNGHTYDVFRHRLIYPIQDEYGRIVSFGGRALPSQQPSVESEYKAAKYLNGKDSKVFNKSYVLYGLYHAAKSIRECGYAYVMEGYTDVISFHKAGFTNSVGSMGTSLTEEQCKLLKRHCKKAVLFYDGDDAGQNATLTGIDLLVAHGFDVSVVPMPEFEDKRKVDPDDLTRLFAA